MSEIKTVSVESIESNPFRMAGKYPLKAHTVDALVRSIKEVGLWEGVIARKRGSKYEIAFGHHRVAAAKKCKLSRVTIIIRDLTDEQMIQFMGRENGEDYDTDFLRLLNTWEAAVNFLLRRNVEQMNREYAAARREADRDGGIARPDRERGPRPQPVEVAGVLGWMRVHSSKSRGKRVLPNDLANAAHAALTLINAGHLDRDDLDGLSVSVAKELCQRVLSRHEQIEKIAAKKGGDFTPRDVSRAKKQVAKAAKSTASSVRDGTVSVREVRGEIDFRTHVSAQRDKGPKVYQAQIAFKMLAGQIQKMLRNDTAREKLDLIKASLSIIREDPEATESLGGVVFQLKMLEARVKEDRRAITATPKLSKGAKVVPLRIASGGA